MAIDKETILTPNRYKLGWQNHETSLGVTKANKDLKILCKQRASSIFALQCKFSPAAPTKSNVDELLHKFITVIDAQLQSLEALQRDQEASIPKLGESNRAAC